MSVPLSKESFAGVYAEPGPFATVYLDATRSTESGPHEVELRWRSLQERLVGAGAETADVEALGDVVAGDDHPGRHGLVLIAAGGRVLFVDPLPQPPLREVAVLSPLPHLMPYLAQRGDRVAYLVVTADRTGADIAVPQWEGGDSQTVEGHSGYPLHRTGRDDWSERHFQNRVENQWESNARDVADAVIARAADTAAELILLAGDERARTLLADQLGSGLRQGTQVVSLEHGGRAEGASADALANAVRDAVLRHVWRRRRELLEHLQQNLGRQEYAVAGVPAVVDAVRKAAADTIVISDDPSSTLRAFFGPEPVQIGLTAAELHDLGVDEPREDRLDAALIRAAVGTAARVVVTPGAHEYLPGGIGALLRYDERASG